MADMLALTRAAAEARSLTEHPAFREVYAKLYNAAFDDFRRSEPHETAKREEAYWRLRTLEDFDQQVQSAIKAPQIEGKRAAGRGGL